MKKKILISCIVILILILFVPIPTGILKDGGTRVYSALTYKIVDWNHLYGCGQMYSKTKIYFLPMNLLSIDSLLAKEEKNFEYVDCEYPEIKDDQAYVNYDFDCQYIRTNGSPDDVEYPFVRIIKSVDELNAYYESKREIYNLESREEASFDTSSGFVDACKAYDAEYFKNNKLLIVVLEEGSGSIRHVVDKVSTSIYKDKVRADVEILRKIPGACTCDMAVWHILIDVPSDFACDDENNVRVFVDGSLKNRNTTTVKYSKRYASVSFELIDGWEYEIVEDESLLFDASFCVVAYPKGDKSNHIAFEFGQKGYCGTELTLKDTYVGRYKAKEGRYSYYKYWNFLDLQNTAGGYMILNGCSEEFYSENKHEIVSMLETLEVGAGCVSEELAIEVAKKFASIEYDAIRAEFEAYNGVWQIMFMNTEKSENEIVNISYDGNLDDRVFLEDGGTK